MTKPKIETEGGDPLDRPKDRQACVPQAIGTCIPRTGHEIQHQARPYDCDSAVTCGRYDRGSRYRNKMAAAFRPRLSRRCGPQKARAQPGF